ncbi:hypothetical protein ACFSM5_10915 [Lacibacterium aquatile]|uniref:Uncharacterized protein n=1 Tax=Lacibacterium aquatile TaxID=1168082 RepID=A0ABW5DSA8_9PROT
MLNQSATAVVARNERWSGPSACEPYEAGWAYEAVVFVRALGIEGPLACEARIQISADGFNWVDEGTRFALPNAEGAVSFARVSHFGNWLRVAADIPADRAITLICTWHVKG